MNDMRALVSPEMESLRAENAEQRNLLKQAKIEQGQIGETISEVVRAIAAERPVSIPRIALSRVAGKPVSIVVQLSDWHIGLVTKPDSVEGFGEFNWEVAQARIAKLARSVAKYTETNRHGYTIDDVVVLCTGDYVSGDIHDGLVRTNEFPVPVQAVKAGLLMAAFVRSLAGVFARVRVEFIAPGNHDRLTKKPQAQDGGWNSWGFVVGSLAKEALSNQPNVTFNLYPVMQTVVDVCGRRYLLGHGDGIIGTWGIPFYGVERKVARESKARMNMPDHRHFHKIVIGHFHTAVDHPDWFIGGSLTGTDENDHKVGRHAEAHQTSWLVHPEHGEFGFTRWML